MKTEQLFLVDLESKLTNVLKSDELKSLKDNTFKYMGVNCDVNGEKFFDDFVLSSSKEYSTDDMRFYQSIRELKSRVHTLFEEMISFEKKVILLEEQELDLADLKKGFFHSQRTQLKIRSKQLDINQTKVQLEFLNQRVQTLKQEISDFTNLCKKYSENGVKPYAEARIEDMNLKIKARYLNFITHNIPLTNPELAFYYNEKGYIVPPDGVVEELIRIGFNGLAEQEMMKIESFGGQGRKLDALTLMDEYVKNKQLALKRNNDLLEMVRKDERA